MGAHGTRPLQVLVISSLDYCNGLLVRLPRYQITSLQKVQNSAARLVKRANSFCNVTQLLCELHWLPVQQRVKFNILLYVFKALHNLAPRYVADMIQVYTQFGHYDRRVLDKFLLYQPHRGLLVVRLLPVGR